MLNDKQIKLFNSHVTALETLGGLLPIHPKLVNAKLVLVGCSGNDFEKPKPSMYAKAILSA